MTGTRSLRVEPPDLDPDDAFLARLALAARYSPRPVRRAHRFGSGRLLLATAGIAVVTTGGAYAAGVLGPLGPIGPLGRHDSPPHHQKSPASNDPTEGTEPVPASPKGHGGRRQAVGASRRPSRPESRRENRPASPPASRPAARASTPSEEATPDQEAITRRSRLTPRSPPHPTGKPSGQPTGKPTDQPTGKPTDNPGGQAHRQARRAAHGQADRQARREAVVRPQARAVRVVTGGVSHGS